MKVPGPRMTDAEYRKRFSELPCCGHVAAVHSDELQQCVSSAGMDPGESCDCPRYRCRRCHHPEVEHHGLGCTHENRLEWRTEDEHGVTIHDEVTLCGCPYFHMALGRIVHELDESAADIRAAIADSPA